MSFASITSFSEMSYRRLCWVCSSQVSSAKLLSSCSGITQVSLQELLRRTANNLIEEKIQLCHAKFTCRIGMTFAIKIPVSALKRIDYTWLFVTDLRSDWKIVLGETDVKTRFWSWVWSCWWHFKDAHKLALMMNGCCCISIASSTRGSSDSGPTGESPEDED